MSYNTKKPHIIEDEGSALPEQPVLDFTGTGVTVTDGPGAKTTVTIPGSSGGSELPIVRYVYLVNDASDQTRMGGVLSNVYITSQSAYSAADAIAVVSGLSVEILIGVTDALTVGGITAGPWNPLVTLRGTGSENSFVDYINTPSAVDKLLILDLKASSLSIGDINTSQQFGFDRASGSCIIQGDDLKINSITASGGGAINARSAGDITVRGITSKITCGNINSIGQSNGIGGNITIENATVFDIATRGGTSTGDSGNVLIQNSYVRTTWQRKGGGGLNPTLYIKDSRVDDINLENTSITPWGVISIISSKVTTSILDALAVRKNSINLIGALSEYAPFPVSIPFNITGATSITISNIPLTQLVAKTVLLTSTNPSESINTIFAASMPDNLPIRFYTTGISVTFVDNSISGVGANGIRCKGGTNVIVGAFNSWIELTKINGIVSETDRALYTT